MELAPELAARFRIERLAGAGGMGRVYRAWDVERAVAVALKVLRSDDALAVERFRREAQSLAELEHPRIVRHLGHGSAGGVPWLAMEWLDGETLAARLATAPLTVAESLQVVTGAAEGLAAAHARGLVHRDVKPSNLFLVDGDVARAKLLDFGIARPLAPSTQLTHTGGIVGTPGYVAPEQAQGDRKLDGRVDVFALGCVLFECLTGRAAFVGEHLLAVLAKILLEEAPRVSELRPDVQAALDDLVARMVAKDARARPRDAAAVLDELAALGRFDAAAPHPAGDGGRALTAGEQRLLSVIVATELPADATAATVTLDVDTPAPDATATALSSVATRHGARLSRLRGDAVVVTLRGHGAATDQAVEAARCALAMRALVPRVPMALATGLGLVGGAAPTGEAIERVVALVRVPHPAGDASLLVDAVTAGLLDARFDVRRDGAILRLHGERDGADALRPLLGRPSAFVGRDTELATLVATWDEVVGEPRARAALVVGAAGMGKTRLALEVRRALADRSDAPSVWTLRGDPMRAGSPFGLLAPAIRHLAGILDGEPLEARRARLAARLGDVVDEAERAEVVAFIGELAGAPFPDEACEALRPARRDPVLMAERLRRAFVTWLDAEMRRRPLLLLVEDLHWADLATVKLLDGALAALADRPWLVLALARPEVTELFPSLWAQRGVLQLRLGELSRRACERLVRSVLGDGVDAATVTRVAARADGNALYLEELIRAVVDGKGDELPGTVLAMLSARIDRLEPDARRVLRAASLVGGQFWAGAVVALLGVERAVETRQWLDLLVERELVVRHRGARFPGEDEYTFRHALLRDAAYALLTDGDRALGHRLAAEWLEAAGEDDDAALAEHYARAGLPERAAQRYAVAAEKAFATHALAVALRDAERGLACEPSTALRVRLLNTTSDAANWSGLFARGIAAAAEAMALADAGSAEWYHAARQLADAAIHDARLGHLDGVVADLRRVDANRRPDDHVRAMCHAGVSLCLAGNFELAEALCDEAAPFASRDGVDEAARVAWHALHAILDGYRGDPHALFTHAVLAADIARRSGDLRQASVNLSNAGFAANESGRYEAAEAVLSEALAIAERVGLTHPAAAIRQNFAVAVARRGRVEESEREQRAALVVLDAVTDRRLAGSSRTYLAQARLRRGDLVEAEAHAREAAAALDIAPPLRAHAQAVLASVLLAAGRTDEALAAAEAGMATLEALGGAVEEGETLLRLTLVEALDAAGRHDAARARLATAHERLHARAVRIADPEWRRSFLENVDENRRTVELARTWGLA